MLSGTEVVASPSAVVFDLDGTLIDSRGDIAAAVNHALLSAGRKAVPAAEIARHVGDGGRALLARVTRLGENDAEVERLLDLFLAYYLAHPVDFTKWADGAPEVLDRLAELDLPLCICTNKARPVADAVLGALGVRTRFRAIYAGGDGVEKKPAPGPLLAIAKKLGVESPSLVMVGDGPQDVECARRAGCRVIGVVSSFGSRDRIVASKPDVVLDSLQGVPDVIRRWCDATARLSVLRPR
jgi:phosphoglycolate phosphatase